MAKTIRKGRRPDAAPVAPNIKPIEIHAAVDRVLTIHACRLNEACAILELASDVLTRAGGNLTQREGTRLMGAIDAALSILTPIAGVIGDPMALGEAAARAEHGDCHES